MNFLVPVVEKLPKGHPVQIYYKESTLIQELLFGLSDCNASEDFEKYFNIFNELATIEKRFVRKENQLFPYLEKHGWTGPSKGMWSFHDTLRSQFRLLEEHNTNKHYDKITENLPYLIEGIQRLLTIEDTVLFPNALELLFKEDWEEFYEGDAEIGWMLKATPSPYPPIIEAAYIHPSKDIESRELSFSLDNTFHYDEGYMTPDQVNLLLRFLPVDITYVDENDKVIFYNRGKNRVFSRSKGIIGREVKFCHPPKSVDMVIRIVEEFRAGTKDQAEFWFQMKDKMIHIRYFAIRNEKSEYKGVVEMSQDITNIQKLTGQKRLLDWD